MGAAEGPNVRLDVTGAEGASGVTHTASPSGISIGVTYAASFTIYGILIPFLPLILNALGHSDTETSLAMSGTGLAALIAPIFFAHLADRKVPFRALMPVLLLATATALALLGLSTTATSTFVIVFATYFALIPALTLLDSFTMDFVIRSSGSARKRTFESYRIWGSLGFMVPTIGLTWWFSDQHIPAPTLIALCVMSCVVAAVCARNLPGNSPSASKAELPSRQALAAALTPPLRGLFVANCFAGSALAIFYITYPRFLQEIGCSTATTGLIINLGVLYEIILMPFSGRIIGALGLRNVILLGLLSLPIRLFISAAWPTIPVAIATQLFHGPLVIGLLIGVPIFLQQNADSSFRHSLQSVNTTINHGLTRIIGAAIAALLIGLGQSGNALHGLTRAIVAAGVLGLIGTAYFGFSSSGIADKRR